MAPRPPLELARPGGVVSSSAVWTLVLPPARRVLCHAAQPPPLLAEWLRRGACIDVVTRCDFESWLGAGGANTHLRSQWEVDPHASYDLALLWDPADLAAVERWIHDLAVLQRPPTDVALWTRNPWAGERGPAWPRVDALLARAGWERGARLLALPAAERVRQIVSWESYTRTPLVQHRRTRRAWKEWVAHQPLWRYRQPARLCRAVRRGTSGREPILERILSEVALQVASGTSLERLGVSPNGVAIASVRLHRATGDQNAILKVPYTTAAEGRVARNAAGLAWAAAESAKLGAWASVAPQLLTSGRTHGWTYTLEEHVTGSDAQGWDEPDAVRVMGALGDLLAHLASSGAPARPLDPATLERLCRAPLRRAAALVDAPLGGRLARLGDELCRRLSGVPVPLVPRHGDFKLENVFGSPASPLATRVIDWELWSPAGLPLLDAWHLVVSRRARAAGCSLGLAIRRWLLSDDLAAWERALVEKLARGLDPRYTALSPWLYWLDRIGPVAARGTWPTPTWAQVNLLPVVDVADEIAVAV